MIIKLSSGIDLGSLCFAPWRTHPKIALLNQPRQCGEDALAGW
jgi:hypothetical protein